MGLPLAYLPPFSPELNPAERIFEEVRRWVEGKIYDTLADKVEAVENYLTHLAGDGEAVKRLAAWEWIGQSLGNLKRHEA